VTSFVKEQKVDHILVNGGSAINVMPKSTMHDLGITIEELLKNQMMIQGFNLEGPRAIGIIRVKLVIGDLSSLSTSHVSTSSISYVIVSKISYKLLLRQPWLHEWGIVASSLHQ